ncbi:hypothetical protein IAT40_006243 [Kwoniella sp. CBS 6097]
MGDSDTDIIHANGAANGVKMKTPSSADDSPPPGAEPILTSALTPTQARLKMRYDSLDRDLRIFTHFIMMVLAETKHFSLLMSGRDRQRCDLTLIPHLMIAFVAVKTWIEYYVVEQGRMRDLPATRNTSRPLRLSLLLCFALSAMATLKFLEVSWKAGRICYP